MGAFVGSGVECTYHVVPELPACCRWGGNMRLFKQRRTDCIQGDIFESIWVWKCLREKFGSHVVSDFGKGRYLQVHPACIDLFQLHCRVILLHAIFHKVSVLNAQFVNYPQVVLDLSAVAVHCHTEV